MRQLPGLRRSHLDRGVQSPRVAIIGGGFGGVGLAVLLTKAGFDSFTMFEKAEKAGGTWWYNQYPGAEVDTVSYVYSYAFKPYGWSRTHARQAELQGYLEETVDQFGLRPHLRLGTSVKSAVWDEDCHSWLLRLDTGEEVEFAVLGTGSTATQLVPELAKMVQKLYLFQREPGWVVPKGERDHTEEEQARLRKT